MSCVRPSRWGPEFQVESWPCAQMPMGIFFRGE
jgi:hypothetical protein